MNAYRPDLSAAEWRKSSYSNTQGGDCVEVADGVPRTVPVRDSKNPQGPVLLLADHVWVIFVAHLKAS
ncbi:DUF397 domain-containing protein [Streptomyces sp. NPDC058745]|uniref:DUF397 domain-containing protein n=1 Tax=Streptomyces sp. NPDC058745 TaxID=3346621 RepID=UPI0036956D16